MNSSLFCLLGIMWCIVFSALLSCTPLIPPVENTDEERYQARIVYDPLDPASISGFVRLGIVSSASADMVRERHIAIQNLDMVADMINEYTNIRAEIASDLLFSDPRMLELGIIMPQGEPIETELEQLTRYLIEGGFVMASSDFSIYREGLEKFGGLVWGTDTRTEYLDVGHPIFSVFFRIPDARLQGLLVNGRLAGVRFSLPALIKDDDGTIINFNEVLYNTRV